VSEAFFGSMFVAAFVGGGLALLAPCSALLLPAFFAYAFANSRAMLRGTLLFLLGLLTVLLPLGMAASLAGRLLIEQRPVAIFVAGATLTVLGALTVFGRAPAVHLGFARRWSTQASTSATYATGVIYGLTGFCSGPLLGGVLTLAAAGQQPLLGAALLLVYALGMAAPLFVLAVAWDRYTLGQRRWLRGVPVRLGRLRLHSTNLIAGALFVILGASFIASQGGALLSGAYDDLGLSALGFRLQAWAASTF
jgi:cytochrome c biogenesis protein CcdA